MNYEIINALDHIDEVKTLFNEYHKMLGVNLCFQNYDDEMNTLPGKYSFPDGRLYLIYCDWQLAGCIALRRHDENRCEMKRLFIRPQFRRLHLGQLLVEKIIQDAKSIGYHEMLLDTLSTLESAVNLYRKMAFEEIPPYYANPLQDVLYFKLKL